MDEPNPMLPGSEEDAPIRRESDLSEMRRRMMLMQAQYRASLERNESIERQLRTTEELLQQAQEKVRSTKRKRIEADHYRSLLHRLRSRWYLRPFIPGSSLQPPPEDLSTRWIYRGPRFDPPPSRSESGRRRHRVLIVGHLLSAMLFGSEKSLLEIIAALDPAKFDLFAVFPERNERVFATLRRHLQGIAVLDYAWWKKERPFREETVSIFEEACRQLAIDLVHANTVMLSDPLIAARRVGIPAITNARELISCDEDLAARLGGTPAEIARIVCANATYVLANSAATLADYPCGTRGSFLYNSVDTEAFDLPNQVDPNCIKVGLISSNILKKGILDFLKLAREAKKRFPSLQFHLIGPENNLIKEWRTGAEPFPDNFCLRGYVSPPADAYRGLNVVLNLSRFAESFGRTVAEAMAARRPVIAYRYGALPELIDDGETGFLVPYLDLPAVLDRLRFFVETPGEITKFGEAARARSMQRFSPATFAHEINSLYERLIAEARLTG